MAVLVEPGSSWHLGIIAQNPGYDMRDDEALDLYHRLNLAFRTSAYKIAGMMP